MRKSSRAFIHFAFAICAASQGLFQKAHAKEWDYSDVKKTYLFSARDDKTIGKLVFRDFSYYLPNVEHNAFNEQFGYEIIKDGQTTTIFIPPERCGPFAPLIKGTKGVYPDLDGDGVPDLPIQGWNDLVTSLRIFSQKTGKLTYSYENGGYYYSLEEIDSGNTKTTEWIMGASTSAIQNYTRCVFKDGKMIVEPWPRSPSGQSHLTWGRKAVFAWRACYPLEGAQAALDQCAIHLRQYAKDASMYAVRAALRTVLPPDYGSNEDRDLAIADANSALSLDPKNALAHAVLGHIHDLEAGAPEAVKEFSTAIALQPENPEWYAARASAYESSQQAAKAIQDYTRVIALDPTNAWAYASRANNNFDANNWPAAIADATAAIALDAKRDPKLNQTFDIRLFALTARAPAYALMRQHAKALPDFETLTKAEPDNPKNFLMLGYCCQTLGMNAKAIGAFKTAFKLNPKYAKAQTALASMLKTTKSHAHPKTASK